jgi:MFS family permease
MAPLRLVLSQSGQQKKSTRLVYTVALMAFFWTIFDLIISYIAPILITERGFSNSQMGMIIAFSSISGAFFDFILARLLRSTNYLKTFFLVLVISFILPFVLWTSHHIFIYLLAMAIWGLYYDLYTFASYDFVSRNALTEGQHARDFGIIELFRSLGGLVAPIITTILIVDKVYFGHMMWPLLFLIIAFGFYLLLLSFSPLHHFHSTDHRHKSVSILTEIFRWNALGKKLLPVLAFMISIYIFDATFWTVGPLFSESFPDFKHFSGFLMILYSLPSMLTAWKIEPLTRRFGKKKTAYITFLLANIFLIPIGFLSSPIMVLFFVFLSSIATSITWPSIEAAFADYTSEAGKLQTEVEGITDLTSNIGYIIGPIFAGFFSEKISISWSFGALGFINVFIIILLLLVTPKQIKIASLANKFT